MKKIKEFFHVLESFYDELHNEEYYSTVIAGCIVLLSIMIFILVCVLITW